MRPSLLVGLPVGWRLLVLERLWEGGPGRLHLIEDGRLVASADTDTSTLPNRPAHLLRFVEEMFESLDDEPEDPSSLMVVNAAEWTQADTSILLRWLVQARQRLEIARLPTTADEIDD